MRDACTIFALLFAIGGSIERLVRRPTEQWETSLAISAICALLAIAWRPTSTITLNGVQSASRSSDGKTSTWQVQTALPPEGR